MQEVSDNLYQLGAMKKGAKEGYAKKHEFLKDFVIIVVSKALAEAMNQTFTDYPSFIDEFKKVGLTPIKDHIVKAQRVADFSIDMECKLLQILRFGKNPNGVSLLIGEVVLVHVKNDLYVNGEIQMSKLKAIGRLGGDLYCRTTDIFEMVRLESWRVG